MACGLRTKGLRAMRVRMGRDSLMVDPTGGGGVLTDGICSGADGARLQVKLAHLGAHLTVLVHTHGGRLHR